MQSDTRYRFITLLVGFGFIAVVLLFLALVRVAADAHVDLDQLPAPVLETLREQAGDETTLVQIFRGSTPNVRAFHIVLELPDGRSERLWLAEDGTEWPPEPEPTRLD